MKKSIISLFLAIIFLFNITAQAKIYDVTQTQTISKGIELTNIKRLDNYGWLNINIAKINITDDDLELKLLKNKDDIKKMQNVKTLADTYGTEIAINGDFFSRSTSSSGSPVGVEVIDGKMIASPAESYDKMAIFTHNYEEISAIDYIDATMMIVAPNDETDFIRSINKYDDGSKISIYNTNWGKLSQGSVGNLVEFVVEDDVITSINFDVGPVEIPQNGYIISFLKDHTTFMLDNFIVGDKVKIITHFDFSDSKVALGGGTVLVKDGKKATITHDVTGNNPRTALGISKNGEDIYFVTVDGRQTSSKGVTLSYFADILIEYGIYNAINLDGGGSTTMVAKKFLETKNSVINSPSDSSLRAVINGIGVVNTNTDNSLSSLLVSANDTVIYSPVKLNVKGLDSSLRLSKDFKYEDVTFKILSGTGIIKDGYFYPESEGKVKIKANIGKKYGEVEINVLPMPDILKLSQKEVKLKTGETFKLSLTGILNDGQSAQVDVEKCGISATNNIFTLEKDTITATKKGTSVITFSYGDVSTSMLLKVDTDSSEEIPSDVRNKDNELVENKKENKNTFKFAVFGNTINRKTLLEFAVTRKLIKEIENNNDYAFFVGDNCTAESEKLKIINASDGQSFFEEDDNAFITFSNKDGRMSFSDFLFMKNSLLKTKSDNVFLFFTNKIVLTQSETKLFETMLEDLTKDKKVYIIHNGTFDVMPQKNAKYFSISGVEEIKQIPDALDLFYIQFYVDDGNLTYEIKNIY
ncbi:MAG: phosphodiester glycosidase family protein [Ruminococcaceae bacterium]|nr:phosphodiester glycosidase family protein [Oscillospiraceae bacterium]